MSLAPSLCSDELIGRAHELSVLDEAVGALDGGGSGVVGVSGPLGVGRSALLHWTANRARAAGHAASFARCSALEADIPYAAVTQLLAGSCPAARLIELAEVCVRDTRSAAMIPLLCGEFLTLAANRPLVLAVDDLQWADPWSLRWFAAMARRVYQAPILLLGTSHSPLSDCLGDDCILDDCGPTPMWELPLQALSAAESTRLLEAVTGKVAHEAVRAGVIEATSGRPGMLRAVADEFHSQGRPLDAACVPHLIAAARLAWSERAGQALRGLPSDALALARVLAAGGAGFEFQIAGSLTGLRGAALDDALRTLLAAGLVVDPESPRLLCQGLGTDVLAAMATPEREALCVRAAELGRQVGVEAGMVADLLSVTSVSELPWAGSALAEASAQRLRQGRPDAAITDLRRALREPMDDATRARLLTRLASIEVTRLPQASDGRLRQVLVRYAGVDSWPSVLQAADLLLSRGDAETARRMISELYLAADGTVGKEALSPLCALGWYAQELAGTEPEVPVAPLPSPPPEPADPAQSGVLAWQLATRAEDRERVERLSAEALSARVEVPLMCRIAASHALLCADDVESAVRGLDHVLADARRRNARATAAQALMYRASAALRVGRVEEGLNDLATSARELPLDSWHPALVPRFRGTEIMLHIRCGRLDLAQQSADRPLAAVADQGAGWAFLLYSRAELALVNGDPGRALVFLDECGRSLRARGWTNPMVLPWGATAAVAHQVLGAPETAARARAEQQAVLNDWGTADAVDRMCGRTMDMLAAFGVILPAVPADEVPTTTESEALAALSPPERDVVGLVVDGYANREIARRLEVATRTVELRLTKAYRKLGFTGRAELVAHLAASGREG